MTATSKHFARLAWLVLMLALPGNALAADTLEPWGIGATDVEAYVGYDGLGARAAERSISGQALLGYGLADRFSAYVAVGISADGKLASSAQSLALGAFGTAFDSDHFDLDLILDLSAGDGFAVAPMLEANFDLEPDLAAWGMYLRGGPTVATAPAGSAFDVDAGLTLVLGTYYALADGHQLLLELDFVFDFTRDPGDRPGDIGGLALGYNVSVHDNVELITQLSVDIPLAGDESSVGIMVGFLATVPSASDAIAQCKQGGCEAAPAGGR